MIIGINWKPIWKNVWKPVWRQAPVPPTPVATVAVDKGGRPRYEQRHREWVASIEKQNADDMEVVKVLTEFLSRM